MWIIIIIIVIIIIIIVGFTVTTLELHFDEAQGVTVVISAPLPTSTYNIRKYVTQFNHLYFTLSKDLPADASDRAVYGVGLRLLVCWDMG